MHNEGVSFRCDSSRLHARENVSDCKMPTPGMTNWPETVLLYSRIAPGNSGLLQALSSSYTAVHFEPCSVNIISRLIRRDKVKSDFTILAIFYFLSLSFFLRFVCCCMFLSSSVYNSMTPYYIQRLCNNPASCNDCAITPSHTTILWWRYVGQHLWDDVMACSNCVMTPCHAAVVYNDAVI